MGEIHDPAAKAEPRSPTVVLAIVGGMAAAFAIVVLFSPHKDPAPPKPEYAHNDPHKYANACAGLFVQGKHLAHALARTHLVPTDPAILQDGPPPRVQCTVADESGDIGAVTGDVKCLSLETSCYAVTAVVLPGGRIGYSSLDQPRKHRRTVP
jgi:hypothetical protein